MKDVIFALYQAEGNDEATRRSQGAEATSIATKTSDAVDVTAPSYLAHVTSGIRQMTGRDVTMESVKELLVKGRDVVDLVGKTIDASTASTVVESTMTLNTAARKTHVQDDDADDGPVLDDDDDTVGQLAEEFEYSRDETQIVVDLAKSTNRDPHDLLTEKMAAEKASGINNGNMVAGTTADDEVDDDDATSRQPPGSQLSAFIRSEAASLSSLTSNCTYVCMLISSN